MQLRYFVPFRAQEGVDAQFALKEKLINIEGVAVDSSVNLNKWQIPDEDLDYVAQSLAGAQLRVDHAESALMVVGKVSQSKRVGNQVFFTAEVGDEHLIEKIIRNYVTHVSIQVDSDDVECSKCKRVTRKEGQLIHLCPGAYEVVHKPRVRELSIVASPAYQNTAFQPVGFAAAMNQDQWDAVIRRVQDSTGLQLLDGNEDVGSRHEKPQEPENEKNEAKMEVKHLSEHDAQQDASPHTAQTVNVAPGETAPKQVDYGPFLKQLQDLKQQIYQAEGDAIDSEIDTLKKHVAEMEAELAKKATKRQLSKKLSELAKRAEAQESEEAEEGEDSEEGGPKPSGPVDVVSKRKKSEDSEEAEAQEAEASKTSKTPYGAGKGIVAIDEMQKDALGDYTWFKDLLKAHQKFFGLK
jgi:chemotaxis protein histidine kinase CheA